MAHVFITFRIMPVDENVDLRKVKEDVIMKINDFGGKIAKIETIDIAYGLKALNLIFMMEESKGGTDDLELAIKSINNVKNVEVIDVRRAIG